MRELSLFTGAGGGLLGTHRLGFTPCGYVEWDDYCQRVLAQRIKDGYLPEAPIFTDVREFAQSGAADAYRGIADVVSAGFPCQPFSVAGKQLAADDERNMWPATADVICRVQPKSVLLENVPGLVSCGYVGTVLGDLAALGYVGRWGVLGAADAGAPHQRDRLWIVAHATVQQRNGRCDHARIGVVGEQVPESGNCRGAKAVADANSPRKEAKRHVSGMGRVVEQTPWWRSDPGEEPHKSGVGRVADGVACRMDRLKAIGNGQVPQCVELAWRMLA